MIQEKRAEQDVGGEAQTTLAALEREMSVLMRRALRRVWNEEFNDPVLDRWTYALLMRLSDEGPMRVGEVAHRFGVDKSTASRHLGRLQTGGLAEAVPDPHDGRSMLVRVTSRGAERLTEVRAARMEPLRRIFAAWPEQDQKDLARLLGRLNSDIDRLGAGERPAQVAAQRG